MAIDTSGPFCSAALIASDGTSLVEKSEDIGRGHAERLMPMLEEALERASMGWKDVSRLAVVVGPGSFTGLRVGLATARGLALGLDAPVHGVSVFEAYALKYGDQRPLTIALDARRGEVWQQTFGKQARTPPTALTIDAAQEALEAFDPQGYLAGSGISLLKLTSDRWQVLDTDTSPDIIWVGRSALAQAKVQPAEPLYLRLPDAKPQVIPKPFSQTNG